MKDLTHYFADTSKPAENTKVEVKTESGKTLPDNTREKKKNTPEEKRKRVKIKISKRDLEDATCKIVDSKVDLVDKTPSPHNGRKNHYDDNNCTPKSCQQLLSKKDDFSPSPKLIDELDENARKRRESDKIEDTKVSSDSENVSKKSVINEVPNSESKKEKIKGRLLDLANKKGYSKRKLAEQEESEKMEIALKQREKALIEESKSNEVNGTNQNINSKRSSCSLLNYFSKVTPEQLEKQRQAMSKVVVKVDVHEPRGSVTPKSVTPVSKSSSKRKKSKSDSKSLLNVDSIELVSSELLILEPEPVPAPASMLQQSVTCGQKSNKVKWSLQIKMNSNFEEAEELSGEDDSFDDEIFTPRSKTRLHKRKLKSTGSQVEEKSRRQTEEKNEEVKPADKKKLKTQTKRKSKDSETCENDTVLTRSKRNHVKEETSNSKTLSNSEDKNEKSSEESGNVTKSLTPLFLNDNQKDNIANSEAVNKRKSMEKIAPLFMKRRKFDPVKLEARRQFLQPDIVEIDETSERPRPIPLGPPIMPFPEISHVTQLDSTANLTNCDLQSKFPLKVITDYKACFDVTQFQQINRITNLQNPEESRTIIPEASKPDIEDALREIKSRCSDAETMWEKVSKLGETKKEEKKKKGRPKKKLSPSKNKVETVDDPRNEVWTSKYKPTSSEDIVGNEDAVKKLRNWLNIWKKPIQTKDESSGDEFYSSDCSRSGGMETNQVAILLGPHGSGKSASVYAVAQELGYNVLEVNASSKRPGKKILKDLEEATKSHRIRNGNMESFGFTTKQASKEKKIPKNSLILLEDVDLVFEEDEGFVSAAFQLALNTKRPIIMTCKDSFPSLNKLAPKQLWIHFKSVTGKRFSTFLELISLVETGHMLPPFCLENLLETGDIRKALLQLQYLLMSGRTLSFSQLETSRKSLWKDTQHGLYKPVIKAKKISHKRKQNESMESKYNEDFLDNLATGLDNISLISRLHRTPDAALNSVDSKLDASLSLVEDFRPYSSLHCTSLEIADWLRQRTLQKKGTFDSKEVASFSKLLMKKNVNEGINLALSQSVVSNIDRRAMSTDYLASLRTICRTEDIRSANNSKRGNRFYHYLQGFVTVKSHVLSAASQILQDKPNCKDVS